MTTTYELTLINDTDDCYFDLVETVTVAIAPNPTAAPTASLVMTGCDVDRVDFAANAAAGTTPYSYVWSGPNGFASTAANPQINTPTSAANGTYQVTITDANGCTSVTEFVNVSGIAPGQFDPVITSTGPACEGEQIILSVPAYNGSVVTYTWSFDADGTGPGPMQVPRLFAMVMHLVSQAQVQ